MTGALRATRRRLIRRSPLLAVAVCLVAATVLTLLQAHTPTGSLLQTRGPDAAPRPLDDVLPVAVRAGLRVAMFAAAARVLSWRARTSRAELPVWRWFARTARVATAAALLSGVVDCLTVVGPLAGSGGGGLVLGVGVLVACPLLYQGLVRWNRYGSTVSEPGDWLNGIGATFALVALGNLLLPLLGSPVADWPWWQEQVWLLRVGAETTLLGSAATVLHIGGLHRDARAWALTAALAVVVTVEVAGARDVAAAAGNGPFSEVGWTLLAVALALGAVVRSAPPLARAVTTTAPTAGAFVVLLVSVGVLVAAGSSTGALAPRALTSAAVAGGLGAVSVAVRGLQLVRLLADLVVHRHEALTDDLTDLANRRALTTRLHAEHARGRQLTLLVMDLDGFREVNERFGHAVGDELLRRAAAVLRSTAGPTALTARLAGDEFAVVLPQASVAEARALVAQLAAVTAEPVLIEGRRLLVSASIGIADSLDAADPADLLDHAVAAMYRARAGGGARAAVHDEAAAAAAAERGRLVEELKALLGDQDAVPGTDPGRLEVHYQPQVGHRGDVVGVEALVRWDNARRGLLPPDTFLPLVEEHGLMPKLTGLVLRLAAEQAARWHGRGWPLRLSVNLSATCLTHPGLLDLLEEVLTGTGVPPSSLVLEVTETSVMTDAENAVARLRELVERGIGISIDDYGTGHSSLAYLRDLPASELKLDRSLVADVGADPRADDIVGGTIALAHRLGLRIVAEGVETLAVLDALNRLDCDETQGYLHSRPLPAAAFEAWFAQASPPPDVAGDTTGHIAGDVAGDVGPRGGALRSGPRSPII